MRPLPQAARAHTEIELVSVFPSQVLISDVPQEEMYEHEVTYPIQKPKKLRKKLSPAEPNSTVEPTANEGTATSAESAIGSLSAGGESAGASVHTANEMIAESNKRLSAIVSSVQEKQGTELTRIKLFLDEAAAAVNAGDGDGAVTLATKAKLLLDDFGK